MKKRSSDSGVDILDVIEFLHDQPNPKDSDLHAWAEDSGFEVDDVDEKVYTLASALVQFLHDGKAVDSGFTEDDADSDELKMGIKIEMEHTSNPVMAKRIALDHLSEIPDYYTRLVKLEEDAKRGNN
jgi:hypothetical protein